MDADHSQFERRLEEVRWMVADGELERADHHFNELRADLAHHMRQEEEIVFPLFEELTGLLSGATVVMRREHVAINAALETMASGLDRQDAAAFQRGWAVLTAILPLHHAKEERGIYPTMDRLLRPSLREAFVRRLIAR